MVPRALDLHAGVLAVASAAEPVLAVERRRRRRRRQRLRPPRRTATAPTATPPPGRRRRPRRRRRRRRLRRPGHGPAEAEPTAGVVSYFEVPVDEEDAGDIVVTLKRRLAAAAAKAAAAAEAERAAAARAEAARLAAEDDDEERFPRVVPVDELGGEERATARGCRSGRPTRPRWLTTLCWWRPSAGWAAATTVRTRRCRDRAARAVRGRRRRAGDAARRRGGTRRHVGALGHVITLPPSRRRCSPRSRCMSLGRPSARTNGAARRAAECARGAARRPPAGAVTAGARPRRAAGRCRRAIGAAVAEVWCGGARGLRCVGCTTSASIAASARAVTLLSQRDGDDVVDGSGDGDGDGDDEADGGGGRRGWCCWGRATRC